MCRFCKSPFQSDEVDTSCPDCNIEIKRILKADPLFLKEILSDPQLKYSFLESVLEDENVVKRIAKSWLALPATDFGLGGPGTIAQYFRK